MKNSVNDFLEEFSENFSDLFVESFLIRYSNEYDGSDVEKVADYAKIMVNDKIAKKFKHKLKKQKKRNNLF